MDHVITLRDATELDIVRISSLVQTTLRVSNARDYPPQVIDRIAENFSPDAVRGFLRSRLVLIACENETIIGTASLEDNRVRAVFVTPERQGKGGGRLLMDAIEARAGQQGIDKLQVQASLTATQFYARLGYREIRDVLYGEERAVIMEKRLARSDVNALTKQAYHSG